MTSFIIQKFVWLLSYDEKNLLSCIKLVGEVKFSLPITIRAIVYGETKKDLSGNDVNKGLIERFVHSSILWMLNIF